MTENASHAELGVLTEFLFKFLLSGFQLPDVGLLIGVGIVCIAIVVIVVMSMRSSVLLGSVVNARRHVTKYPDRYAFTEQFDSVAEKFLASRYLGRAWYEFEETLIRPPNTQTFTEARYEVIQNTRRPHEYFNLQVIPSLRVKPFMAPSTFVAIGLLFTFVGLVAALTAAASAFTSSGSNGETIELAINNLLIVAGAKFFASIGGLLSSLLVTIASSWWQRRINNATYQLCDDLEKRLWYISQTQVASDQYAHAIRQTERLEELKDQLAVSIGEQFKLAMEDVPQQIAGLVGNELTLVSSAIDNMADNLGSGIGAALAQSAGSVSDELRKDTESTIRTMVEELTKASGRLEVTTESFSKLAGGFNESTESLKGSAGQLYQATNSVRPLIESLEQVQKDASSTQEVFTSVLDRLQQDLQGARDVVQENVQETRAVVENLRELWSAQATQLNLADGQLEAAFEQVERMTRSSAEHLNNQLSKMDSSVAGIATHLNTSNATLTEAVEGLDDTVSKLVSYPNR